MLLDRRSRVRAARLTGRALAFGAATAVLAGCVATEGRDGNPAVKATVTASPQAVVAPAGGPVAASTTVGGPVVLQPVAAAPAQAPGVYLIGPQDTLDISVFEVAELNRTLQVSGTGTINFPLIGDVPAAGRSAHDLEVDIAKRLDQGYVRDPHVSVSIKEFNSQRIVVDGAVRKAGVFPLRDRVTLTQAIALAGGQDPDTAGSGVVVVRQVAGGQQTLRFDLGQVRDGKMVDPILANGDSVIVETSNGKAVLNGLGKIAPVGSLIGLIP